MRPKILIALAAALLLSACATSQQIPAGKPIRSVAVVSAIPETLELVYIGFTVFNNTDEVVQIDWNLDAVAEAAATDLLNDRYEIRQVTINKASLRGLHRGGISLSSFRPVAEELQRQVQPGQADAILLIDGLSSYEKGNALYKEFNMGPRVGSHLREGRSIGVLYEVVVYDGSTFEPIAFSIDRMPFFENAGPPWSGQPWENVSDRDKRAMRKLVEKYIRGDLAQQMVRLGFIVP